MNPPLPEQKLFAVYLGGRAPKCNTELHDVVFVVGTSIEATYEQLMEKWFGDPLRLHIDSWLELSAVDGYRVSLWRQPSAATEKLFFINLGAYRPGEFTELHANAFLVAQRARSQGTRQAACSSAPRRSTPTTFSTWTTACRSNRSTATTCNWNPPAKRCRFPLTTATTLFRKAPCRRLPRSAV